MPVLASIHISIPCARPTTLFVGAEVPEDVGGVEGALVDEEPVAEVMTPGLAAA